IKADPVLADTKLVLATDIGERGDARRYREGGFSAYLVKPIKQHLLQECLLSLSGRDKTTQDRHRPLLITQHTLSEQRKQSIRLLVAEDNETNQLVAQGIIENLGYRAHIVSNGQEALKALQQRHYDLVFMDVQMPVLDGITATENIRFGELKNSKIQGLDNKDESQFTTHASQGVPIVALTAHTMKGDRERCIAAGMNDYIPKPLRPEDISRCIETYIHNKDSSTATVFKQDLQPDIVFNKQNLLSRLNGDEHLSQKVIDTFTRTAPLKLKMLKQAINAQ
ncbi:MAG: response regulator, partial [Deltaproteobacteria bacterium]|nr:response regulator [Deltaproteobacteria bacterium]